MNLMDLTGRRIFHGCTIKKSDLHRWQTTGARREERVLVDGTQLHRLPVYFQEEGATQGVSLFGQIGSERRVPILSDDSGPLNFLICWDFSHVDEIAHLN